MSDRLRRLLCHCGHQDAAEPASALAQVLVKGADGGVVDARELPLSTTGGELKAFVAETTGQCPSRFTLALGENNMDDSRSLMEHDIKAEAEVTMIMHALTLETDEAALRSMMTLWQLVVPENSVCDWSFVAIEDERIAKVQLVSKKLRGPSLFNTANFEKGIGHRPRAQATSRARLGG